MVEAARACGNFARSQPHAAFLRSARLGEALLLLLDHNDWEVRFVAAAGWWRTACVACGAWLRVAVIAVDDWLCVAVSAVGGWLRIVLDG